MDKDNLPLVVVFCLIFSVTLCHSGSATLEGDFREVFVNEENSWYLDMNRLKPLVQVEGENGWEVYLERDYKIRSITEVYQVLLKKNPPSFKMLDSYAFDIDGDLVDQWSIQPDWVRWRPVEKGSVEEYVSQILMSMDL